MKNTRTQGIVELILAAVAALFPLIFRFSFDLPLANPGFNVLVAVCLLIAAVLARVAVDTLTGTFHRPTPEHQHHLSGRSSLA